MHLTLNPALHVHCLEKLMYIFSSLPLFPTHDEVVTSILAETHFPYLSMGPIRRKLCRKLFIRRMQPRDWQKLLHGKQSIWIFLSLKYFRDRRLTMYRTVYRAGRRLHASKLWKPANSVNLPSQTRTIGASVLLARCSSSSSQKFTLSQIASPTDAFSRRHIGPNAVEEKEMLRTLNLQVSLASHAVFRTYNFELIL